MIDLFVIKHFLEPSVCERIVADMNVAQGEAATVYGLSSLGAVDQNVRQTLRLRPSSEIVELIIERLADCRNAIEQHFGIQLSECEEPQFLRYRKGDFFVAHQDGNTGLLRLESERRRVSTVMFLSRESDSHEPNAHCGGSLVFTDRSSEKFRAIHGPGTLLAFLSETTHEVTPVTHGERYSIVSWYW